MENHQTITNIMKSQHKTLVISLFVAINLIFATLYAQNTSLPVGTIPGSADVTAMGAATYSIPIEVVPGTQGVQPNLSVVYNSMAGIGILGSQWDLGGLSAITRVGQNKFLDSRSSSVMMDNTDRFALDGNRLVCINGAMYGYPGVEHLPEFEDFSKIIPYGSIENGPAWFKVYRDDGSVVEYGNSADSRQMLGTKVYSWYINKITDINGNYMTFTYGGSGGEIWIDHIDYTGNSAASLSPYARVSFTYDIYPYLTSDFVAGYEIVHSHLLRKITVQYKNGSSYEMVRQYQFTYSNESPKRLTKVQLMASDSSALNPTRVEWTTLTYGTPTTSQLSVPNMVFDEGTAHFALDFNGDGLSDILEYNNSKRRVLINANNSFQELFADNQSHNQHIFSVIPADLVGDGYSEVITTYYNSSDRELSVTALVSSQNEVTLLQLSNVDSVKTVLAGDFYGDGTHQLLICYNQDNVLLYRINRQTEITIDHSTGKFDLLDYDGDGQLEFALVKNNTMSVYKYNPTTEHIECICSDYHFYKKPLSFGDFNGDGISDYIYFNSFNNYGCALGNGNGFFEQIPLSRQLTNDTLSPILLDVNNDGFSDILTFRKTSNGSLKLFVYLGKGYYNDSVQLFFNQSWASSNYPYVMPRKSIYGNPVPDLFNLVIGNFNSDKRLDFLVAWQYDVNSQLTLYEFNENKTNRYATKITQGDSSYVQWHYQDIQGYYYQYASFIKPLPYYFDVVKTMRASGDRPSRESVYHYQFKNPQYSFRRHSVLGFSTITQVDSVRNASDTVHLANLQANGVWQDVLMPVKKRVRIGYNITQDVTYSPTIHVLAQNRRLPLIYRSVSHDNLSLTSVTQHNTVNSEGRLVGSSTIVKDINATEFLTKDSVLYHFSTINLSNGGFTTHTDSSVTYSFFGNSTEFFTKKQSFTYYSNGRLLSSSRLCDGVTNTVTYNTYDMFGNVKSETSSATGCESRSVSRLFDATGRFCVTEYNAMSHVKRATNDPRTGLVLSSTDVNQLTTTYSYDAFGKLISVRHPDGNTDTIRYGWYTGNEIPYAKYYTLTHIPGKTFDTERYYDLLGRNICTRENGMFTDIQYNTKGLVEKVSKPYIRNTPDNQKIWHIMHYDSYGRIETESDTYSNLSYSYYGRTTTITDNLRQVSSSKTTDAAGRVILASDQGGQIQYEYAITTHNGYNVLNTAVTTNGHTTSMWTDQRGNRIRLQDPDAGTTVYDYNAFGELVRQVNAKGDTLKMSYDKLGRVVQKQYIDSLGVIRSMCYFYDNQDHNNKGKGKISRVTVDGVNAEQYTYDALSRPAQHTRYIDGATFQESYTYNTYGQLATLTYPDGFATDFTYTGKGYLEEITRHDSHKNIFKAYSYNIYGQPNKCGYGNATATEYEYNPAGLLTHIKTGLKNYGATPIPHDSLIPMLQQIEPNGTNGINGLPDLTDLEPPFSVDSTIQNFRYTYDNMGRLIQRTQKNSQYETFQYDNMDRLTSFTQGNGISRPSTFTTTYDAQGNILSNTLAGTYSYDSGKPHAVTEVTPSNAFPNAISAADCETDYNVFNQPSRIAEGDVEILLEYGADNQRVKAVFKDHGHTLYTRYYVNANYEVEVDAAGVVTHYNYIYGSTGLAAICVRRNGVDSMYYVHPDRLGSYTHITDSSRHVIRALHFDPWGNVKSDADWKDFVEDAPVSLTSSFRFSRGFTGHEHYADLKIINMNGRLYDPVIARFFSPDNFVQAPGFTQSYNRYSYCLNNPLQYTDPSGESFISDFLYGICNFLTLPARAITESVSWLNDHINGNVKADGYFHSDYLFNSAPPHYIDYQNVINLQNPYVYSFYEPDMMADADGTTYRTEYYWTAVGAGGTYNLTFANQTFSGTFGPYKEHIQWHTREVPVESNVSDVKTNNHNTSNVDVGLILNFVGLTSSIYADGNSGLNYKIPYGFSAVAYGGQMLYIGKDIYVQGSSSFESVFDFTMANLGFWGGPWGAYVAFTLDMYKRGIIWTANYFSELEMELRRMNSPQTYY
jgi:RHS repeat-associated protein